MLNTSKAARPFTRKEIVIACAAAAAVLVLPGLVEAGSATTGLPIEAPLEKLKQSLTGPVAGIVAVLAFFGLGWQLVWGGEMNDFNRKAVMGLMGVAFVVGASSAYNIFFGSGALLPAIG